MVFQNPTLVKSKNENHQNSMCDSSKEPYGYTDHKSEKILIFYWFVSKKTVLKRPLLLKKKEFFAIHLVKFQYFFNFSSDLWSVSQCGSFELSHIEFWWFSFLTLQGWDFEKSKFKIKLSKKFDNFFFAFSKTWFFGRYLPNKGPTYQFLKKNTKIDVPPHI